MPGIPAEPLGAEPFLHLCAESSCYLPGPQRTHVQHLSCLYHTIHFSSLLYLSYYHKTGDHILLLKRNPLLFSPQPASLSLLFGLLTLVFLLFSRVSTTHRLGPHRTPSTDGLMQFGSPSSAFSAGVDTADHPLLLKMWSSLGFGS